MQLHRTIAVAALALTAGTSYADVSCLDSILAMQPGFIACNGPTLGNLSANETPFEDFASQTAFDWTGVWVGSTEDGEFGPFANDPGTVTYGTLTLDQPLAGGMGFVIIGLKGGPSYSTYLFATDATSFQFDTLGLVKGSGSAGPALSHAAVFIPQVPEPTTGALLLAGLGVVVAAGFRRSRRLT